MPMESREKEQEMITVDEIVAAASKLNATQLLKLRQKLDRLEKKTWDRELAAVTAQMKKRKISDDEIDRLVMRRRREGRT
jgi:hypothetical protein